MFLIVSSCSTPPSVENLTKVLNSEKSTITLIKSHGNITGSANRIESEEKFEITNENDKVKVKYFKPAHYSDSIFTFDLNNNEIDSIIMILKQSVENHNPNKEYGGCCMCSNVDFSVSNGNIKMEVKLSEEIEFMLYSLTKKYGKALIEAQEGYYNKVD